MSSGNRLHFWLITGSLLCLGLPSSSALADFVTYNDAITKMRYAATNREETGQPFFLVTGIKRPHLNWRAPAGYVDMCAHPNQLTPSFRL